MTRHITPTIELCKKFLTLRAAALNSRVKIIVRRGNAQVGKFFGTETANRTYHHCGKLNVAVSIVQQVQQVNDDLNFGRLEKIFFVGHVSRYAESFQRVKNVKGSCLRRTVQNHNVAQFKRSISIAVTNEFASRKQFVNFFCNEAHLNGNVSVVRVKIFFLADKKKFGAFVKIFFTAQKIRTALQLCRRVVSNFSRAKIHQPLKNFVDRVNNLRTTAKIFRQVNQAISVTVHFVLEVRRVNEPKTIN